LIFFIKTFIFYKHLNFYKGKQKMNSTAIAPMGHNQPPSDIEIIAENVQRLYPDILQRAEQLMQAVDRVPEKVESDEEAGKIGDYIKQITMCKKNLDAIRVSEKEPYLAKGRAVDGFFKPYAEKLTAIIEQIKPIQAEWVRKKEEAERRRREEEAARKAEEAAALLREAERKRQEAEALRIEQERQAREAAAAAEAKRIAQEAAAAEERRKQQEEIDRLKREQEEKDRAAREEIARMKAESDKKDAEAKAALEEAERRRKEEKKAADDAIRAEQERAREIERQAKEQARELKSEIKENEKNLNELGKAAKALDRESNRDLIDSIKTEGQGRRLEMTADKAAQSAGRVRGDQGSLSSVRREWVGHVSDRMALDLESLRPYFREDDLNHALRQYIKAGGRNLKGANIFEDDVVTVR
jgi:chromosome segregation ATPase